MKGKTRLAILMGLVGSLLCACTTRLGDFTVLSTKNVPYNFVVKGKGEGEDVDRIIIIIPTKVAPNMKEATDQAIEQRKGDGLINARVYYNFWYIPYIYGEESFTVSGDVISTRDLVTDKTPR